MRIGFGYDVHQLVEGKPLFLGGLRIPHIKGTLGHSDADVLIHAICDALLGAAALGDIGLHFPDTDPAYNGIDSKILLGKVKALLNDKGFIIQNLDTTLALQKPKIAPYIPEMRKTIASILELPIDKISIKATTTEHLGFEGREEGISAYAVTLLEERKLI